MIGDKAWVDIISGVEEEDLISVDIIDKLITDHRNAIEGHRKEIKLSQKSIENLELKKISLKYGNDTVIFELADKLNQYELAEKGNFATPFNWSGFNPENKTTIQYYFYERAKKIIDTAKELNVSVAKAIKLVTI